MRKRRLLGQLIAWLLWGSAALANIGMTTSNGAGTLQQVTDKGNVTSTGIWGAAAAFSSLTTSGNITAATGTVTANIIVLKEAATNNTATLTEADPTASTGFTLVTTQRQPAGMINSIVIDSGMSDKGYTGDATTGGNGVPTELETDNATWSISIWGKTGGPSVTWATATSIVQSGLGWNGNQIEIYYYTAPGAQRAKYMVNAVDWADGNWHHIVVTHGNGNTITGYIDNVLLSLSDTSYIQGSFEASDTIFLDEKLTPTTLGFGNRDDIRIYNGVLGAGTVTSLYNGGVGTQDTTGDLGTNLLLHWLCDDGGDATLTEAVQGGGTYDIKSYYGGVFTSDAAPGGSDTEATQIAVTDGTANGERGKVLFGDDYGSTTLQGRTIALQTNLTDRLTVTEAGIISVATDTLKIGGAYAAVGENTASTTFIKSGFATVSSSTPGASVTFVTPFPNSISSVTCTMVRTTTGGETYHGCYVDADTITTSAFDLIIETQEAANIRFYWIAIGN